MHAMCTTLTDLGSEIRNWSWVMGYGSWVMGRAGGRTGLAGQGRTGQAGRGRGRMSVRPCRPWWYHISGHYPCVYAEIETSKLNIRLQSTVSQQSPPNFLANLSYIM